MSHVKALTKSALWTSGACLGFIWSASAVAQQVNPPAEPPAEEPVADATEVDNSESASPEPTEIIVTAQRRSERLQDVPVSVSVVTGETLKNAVINSADRLEQIVPGIRMGRSGSELRPAIRGTYTEIVSANGDPRIGVYMDDIYQSRTSQVPPIVDLDRVEVQKGPQGTLYGRNSFGGNIAFYSALPKNRLEYSADAVLSSDQRRIEGALNLPISDGLAFRLAGVIDDLRPYVKNVGTGNDPMGTKQKYIRGTLRFQPPALEQLELILRASYLDIGGTGGGGFGYKFRGVEVDRALITAPGGSITVNGITYALPNGFNGNSFTGTFAPYDTRFRDGIADINGADIGIPIDPDPYKVNYAGDFYQDGSQKHLGGTINFDVGPVRLRSISSYTDFEITRGAGTLLPVLLDYSDLETTAKTITQELQVLSNRKDSPLQWIAGFYYLDDDVRERSATEVNRSYVTATAPAGQQYYPFGFTFLPAAGTGFNRAFNYDSFSAAQQKTKSHAFYGQVSYTFAEKLTLTGGIRRTTDKKRVAASRFFRAATGPGSYFEHSIDDPIDFKCNGFIAASPTSVSADPTTVQQAYQFICNNRNDKFTTYRAAADYKFTRNNMVYASYSTGAHSGGFNTGVVTTNSIPALVGFEPEIVKAYEIGSKNSFLNGRMTLNGALFYNKYTDLHAQTSIPNPNNPLSVIALVQNIGKDDAYGLDLEATYRPTKQLKFSAAYNWLHAREREYAVNVFEFGSAFSPLLTFCRITPSCNPTTGEFNTVQGTPFPNARTDPNRFIPLLGPDGNPIIIGGVPQLRYVIAGEGRDGTRYVSKKAFSPEHTFQFGASYEFEMGGGATLTPEVQFYYNGGYILSDLTPDFGHQPSYTKTDLRLTFRPADDRFRVQAFINNVEDKAVITRAVYSNHRSQLATYARPRTYGVSAGFRF